MMSRPPGLGKIVLHPDSSLSDSDSADRYSDNMEDVAEDYSSGDYRAMMSRPPGLGKIVLHPDSSLSDSDSADRYSVKMEDADAAEDCSSGDYQAILPPKPVDLAVAAAYLASVEDDSDSDVISSEGDSAAATTRIKGGRKSPAKSTTKDPAMASVHVRNATKTVGTGGMKRARDHLEVVTQREGSNAGDGAPTSSYRDAQVAELQEQLSKSRKNEEDTQIQMRSMQQQMTVLQSYFARPNESVRYPGEAASSVPTISAASTPSAQTTACSSFTSGFASNIGGAQANNFDHFGTLLSSIFGGSIGAGFPVGGGAAPRIALQGDIMMPVFQVMQPVAQATVICGLCKYRNMLGVPACMKCRTAFE